MKHSRAHQNYVLIASWNGSANPNDDKATERAVVLGRNDNNNRFNINCNDNINNNRPARGMVITFIVLQGFILNKFIKTNLA